MPREQLTAEALEGWRADPVTRAFYQLLREFREDLKEQWARGAFSNEEAAITQVASAGALHQIRFIEQLLQLTVEQFNEGLGDGTDSEENASSGSDAREPIGD